MPIANAEGDSREASLGATKLPITQPLGSPQDRTPVGVRKCARGPDGAVTKVVEVATGPEQGDEP
jgi:hypothetical protein